eukprot:4909736-Prymnesium_polylepis.1
MPVTVMRKRKGNKSASSIASVSWRALLCESTMGCASVYALRIDGHLRSTAAEPDSTVSSECDCGLPGMVVPCEEMKVCTAGPRLWPTAKTGRPLTSVVVRVI